MDNLKKGKYAGLNKKMEGTILLSSLGFLFYDFGIKNPFSTFMP